MLEDVDGNFGAVLLRDADRRANLMEGPPNTLATSSPLVHGRRNNVEADRPRDPRSAPTGTRRAGVLLPMTSLPGPDGIGDLGAPSRDFVDWLAGPVSACGRPAAAPAGERGDEPFRRSSAFAGDPLLDRARRTRRDRAAPG